MNNIIENYLKELFRFKKTKPRKMNKMRKKHMKLRARLRAKGAAARKRCGNRTAVYKFGKFSHCQ